MNTFLAVQTCKASSLINIIIYGENRATCVISVIDQWGFKHKINSQPNSSSCVIFNCCCLTLECCVDQHVLSLLFFVHQCLFVSATDQFCLTHFTNQFNLWGLKWSNDCQKGAHFIPRLGKIPQQSCLNPPFSITALDRSSYSIIKTDTNLTRNNI